MDCELPRGRAGAPLEGRQLINFLPTSAFARQSWHEANCVATPAIRLPDGGVALNALEPTRIFPAHQLQPECCLGSNLAVESLLFAFFFFSSFMIFSFRNSSQTWHLESTPPACPSGPNWCHVCSPTRPRSSWFIPHLPLPSFFISRAPQLPSADLLRTNLQP